MASTVYPDGILDNDEMENMEKVELFKVFMREIPITLHLNN